MKQAFLVKRVEKTGSFGSRPEAFSNERISFRASILPDGGEIGRDERGMLPGKKLRLLAARDLNAAAGDGVYVDGEFFIIRSARKWTAHLELDCGARA